MSNNLKVKNNTEVGKLAGAIAGLLKDGEKVVLECVGAGAVNQAIKSVATARGFVGSLGYDIVCKPSFFEIRIDDGVKTAIRMILTREVK